MKQLNKLLLVLFCLTHCLSPCAYAIDLIQAWEAAKLNDAEFTASQYRLVAGLEKRHQALAIKLPELNLNASFANNETRLEYGRQNHLDNDVDGNQYGYALSIVYPLYNRTIQANSQQLNQQVALSQLDFRRAEQDLILRVSRAYFDLAIAEQRVKSVLAQKNSVLEQVNMTQKSYDLGIVTINDFYEAKASLDRILSDEIMALNDLSVKRHALEQLTGIQVAGLNTIAAQMELDQLLPIQLNTLSELAMVNSDQVISNQLTVNILEQEILKHQVRATPIVELYASYNQTWNDGGLSRYGGRDSQSDRSIGIRLNLPLYTGGNRSSRLRESIAQKDQQRDQLALSVRNSEHLTFEAFQNINASVAHYQALQQRVLSAEKLLQSSKISRKAGLRTTADVLRADQNYHQAKFDLINAGYDYLFKKLQLERVTGVLNEMDLNRVNQFLSQKG